MSECKVFSKCSEKKLYIPIFEVFNALGHEVHFSKLNGEILLRLGRKNVTLKVGLETGSLNGFEITLEAPVKEIDGEIMVPSTFLSDIFNLKIDMDYQDNVITISEKTEAFHRAEQLIFFHEELMKETKADIKKGTAFFVEAFQKVKEEADAFLKEPIDSVIHKTMIPPSGNMHDYLTIAPYFWPDPESESGLPWKPKDGQINPKSRGADTDFVRTSDMLHGIEKLCLVYYYSDKQVYLEKVLECIRSWFIHEDTRMNPYVKYGQSVPGGVEGRPLGIIEWTAIVNIITALQLLERNNMIPHSELDTMIDWFTAYISWLQRSELGVLEDEQRNNHGSNYDYQLVGILLYLNHREDAIRRLEYVKTKRIADYIMPDGSQPFELRRTKSMNYTCMNLRVLTKVADLAKRFTDIDLWNYETEDGKSLKKAYVFLKPYILNEKEWTWQQIQETVDIKLVNTMRPLFINAKNLFGDAFLDVPSNLQVSIPYFDVLRFHMKCEKTDDEIVWKSYQI